MLDVKELEHKLKIFNDSRGLRTHIERHLFANDLQHLEDADKTLSFLKKYVDSHIRTVGPAPESFVSLIVGNGYVMSLIDAINANTIIICDYDHRVHDFIDYCKKIVIENSEKVKEGSKNFNDIKQQIINDMLDCAADLSFEPDPDYPDIKFHNRHYYECKFKKEMELLRGRHFLDSESRFIECAKLLQEKYIYHIHIDLFNIDELGYLTKLLWDLHALVPYLNLTNLPDYDVKRVLKTHLLNKLPFAEPFHAVATSLDHPMSEKGRHFIQEFDFVCSRNHGYNDLEKLFGSYSYSSVTQKEYSKIKSYIFDEFRKRNQSPKEGELQDAEKVTEVVLSYM
jgi:hypothetical protein